MKYLDWQQLRPTFAESTAASRLSTQAATFLGLTPQGLPEAAVTKAVIAELLNAVAQLGGGAQGGPGTPTVTITPGSIPVVVGGTFTATVTVLDANQQPISGAVVGLSTTDPTIAVVEDITGSSVPSVTTDASGAAQFLISGVGPGNTSVIAVSNGITSNAASVAVGGGAISLTLAPANITVPVGGSTPLLAHLLDAAGNPMAGQTITVTSSNPAVGTVPATVTTDSTGSAQIAVAGVSAGQTTISATPTVSGITQTSVATVQAASNTPRLTIGYTDYSTPYQSSAAAQRQMAFIASKTAFKWKLLNGLTPSGGYPSNVVQIPYTLMEQVKCYDGPANLLTQQGPDYATYCSAHSLDPESGYLHYIAGAAMMPDTILSIDGSGNATMKYDTETHAGVYNGLLGKSVVVAGNSNAALNGTWTVLGAAQPATPGESSVVTLNTPAGATGTGGTIQGTASGNRSVAERYRTPNAPFTPSWHIAPASAVRKQYELDRLSRILASKYSGYGVFIDSMSNNVFPAGAATLEYNPANSTQYHNDLAALITALRAAMGTGSWRYVINTGNYNDSGITQLISAAGSAHMESIITDHSPSQWPGTDQSFVATQLANGSAVEILNDVSVVDSEGSFGAGPYANDPLPASGNVNAMAYVIQSIVNAYMVWNGGTSGELAVNLWNDLWIKPSPDLGGIDSKWLGMLDYLFGTPTAAATTLVSGVTDPLGQGVSVQSRAYGNNLAVYRTTSSGTTSWADTAAYTVTLPASTGAGGKWQRVKSDGTLDVAISTIALHPMMGVLLVPAGGSISLTPASGSAAVGQAVSLTVTLLDASGNPVSGQVITIASSVPADVTVPATVTTDSAGKATFNATGAAAGSSNVTAAANGETSSAAVITVTAPTGSGASDIFAADSITGIASGGGVGTWTNDADNTRNASQATATLQPQFKTGVLNKLPAVFYPSANVGQGLTYTSLAHTAWTLFFVVTHPSGSSSSHHGVLHANPGWRVQILDASSPYTVQFTSIRSTTNGVWQAAGVALPGTIIQIEYDSSSLSNVPTIKVNGTAVTVTQVTAPVGTQVSTAGTATIGNDPSLGTNDAFYGNLCEFTVWDGVVTSAVEATEGQRLGTKWSIANAY